MNGKLKVSPMPNFPFIIAKLTEADNPIAPCPSPHFVNKYEYEPRATNSITNDASK